MKRIPSKIFVDTNVFYALRDKNDSTHKKAVKILDEIQEKNISLFTSSYVIGETLTLISLRLGKRQAIEFVEQVEVLAEEIFITRENHMSTINLFLKQKSKNISFIDCSSVVVMKENGIKYAFTFDKHFEKLGVKLLK